MCGEPLWKKIVPGLTHVRNCVLFEDNDANQQRQCRPMLAEQRVVWIGTMAVKLKSMHNRHTNTHSHTHRYCILDEFNFPFYRFPRTYRMYGMSVRWCPCSCECVCSVYLSVLCCTYRTSTYNFLAKKNFSLTHKIDMALDMDMAPRQENPPNQRNM